MNKNGISNATYYQWKSKYSGIFAIELNHNLIEPGSPTQNANIKSFNRALRDECLDANWFESLEQARKI